MNYTNVLSLMGRSSIIRRTSGGDLVKERSYSAMRRTPLCLLHTVSRHPRHSLGSPALISYSTMVICRISITFSIRCRSSSFCLVKRAARDSRSIWRFDTTAFVKVGKAKAQAVAILLLLKLIIPDHLEVHGLIVKRML